MDREPFRSVPRNAKYDGISLMEYPSILIEFPDLVISVQKRLIGTREDVLEYLQRKYSRKEAKALITTEVPDELYDEEFNRRAKVLPRLAYAAVGMTARNLMEKKEKTPVKKGKQDKSVDGLLALQRRDDEYQGKALNVDKVDTDSRDLLGARFVKFPENKNNRNVWMASGIPIIASTPEKYLDVLAKLSGDWSDQANSIIALLKRREPKQLSRIATLEAFVSENFSNQEEQDD